MADSEKAFAFLHDNIPQWNKNIAEIDDKIAHMQNELAKASTPIQTPAKRRNNSIESIKDVDAIMGGTSTSATAQQGSSVTLVTRKRKTASVQSGHASGPLKFRSRAMVVVNYDGQIQNSFEQLVRAIGTGRNMLRKAKMAAKMDAMAALADSSEEDDDDAIMSKIGYRQRTGLSAMRTRAAVLRTDIDENPTTPTKLFDSTDKALEHAQGLCEKAAHQSLRDGDCRKELDGARAHFAEALAAAKQETERYAAKKKEEEQKVARQELCVEKPTSLPASPAPHPKRLPPTEIQLSAGTMHTTSTVVDIEIDDDEEDDDMDFVMPPIRLTSRV